MSLIAWILLLSSHVQIPSEQLILQWQPEEIFSSSPKFLLDDIAWSYALCIVTALLAFMLTSIEIEVEGGKSDNQIPQPGWSVWAAAISFSGFGIISVFTGNLITVILFWVAMDILEIAIRMATCPPGYENDRIMLLFSSRVASIIPIGWAIGIARAEGLSIELNLIQPQLSIYLILAAVLRLGLIPVKLPSISIEKEQTKLETLFRLIPTGTALMLITRVASVGLGSEPNLFVSLGILLFAVFGSITWLTSRDRASKLPYFILALVAFSLYSAINIQVTATLAWGTLLFLSGGMLFFYTNRDRRLLPVIAIGVLSLTTLPYTAGWYGVGIYSPGVTLLNYGFMIPHIILIYGYIQFMIEPGVPISGAQRLVWIIYPWGLLLLPITQYIIAYWVMLNSPEIGQSLPKLIDSWPAFVVSALAGTMIYLRKRGIWLNLNQKTLIDSNLIYTPISQLILLVYTGGRYITNLIDQLLEGRGGILWTILFLTLIISILSTLGN